jgi:hypothetical protein
LPIPQKLLVEQYHLSIRAKVEAAIEHEQHPQQVTRPDIPASYQQDFLNRFHYIIAIAGYIVPMM